MSHFISSMLTFTADVQCWRSKLTFNVDVHTQKSPPKTSKKAKIAQCGYHTHKYLSWCKIVANLFLIKVCKERLQSPCHGVHVCFRCNVWSPKPPPGSQNGIHLRLDLSLRLYTSALSNGMYSSQICASSFIEPLSPSRCKTKSSQLSIFSSGAGKAICSRSLVHD